MKKNAFTLIELLAVVVILAIIALIAVPRVVDSIKTSKEAMYKEQVNRIIESTEKLIQNDVEYLPAEVVWNYDVEESEFNYSSVKSLMDIEKISLSDLQKLGYLKDKDIKNPINTSKNMDEYVAVYYNYPYKQYEVVYCISEDYYKYYYSKDEYEKKVSVLCDENVHEDQTCILEEPTIAVSPSNNDWSIYKNIKFTFADEGEYFIKLQKNETLVSGTAVKCLDDDPFDCNGTVYNANDIIIVDGAENLFKVTNGIELKSENESFGSSGADAVADSVTAYIKADEACQKKADSSISKIDLTAPEVAFEIQRTGTSFKLFDFVIKDDKSGISSKEYSIDNGVTWKKIDKSQITERGLEPGATYNVMVRAINGTYKEGVAGRNEIKEGVNATTTAASIVSINPVKALLKENSSTTGSITFKVNTENADEFKVEYKKSDAANYTLYRNFEANNDNCKMENSAISCTITGLTNDTNYNVRVTAVNKKYYNIDPTNPNYSAVVEFDSLTSSIPSPKLVSVTPSDWTNGNKKVTISYPKGSTSNPEYYFYVNSKGSNDIISVNRASYFCGTRTSGPCDTAVAKDTALQTGWYKLKTKDPNINLTITYTREYEYTFHAETHDGTNKSARWNGVKFERIDKTPPKISNLKVANTGTNSIKLTYDLSDKLTDRPDVDGSGIASAENGGVDCICKSGNSSYVSTNKHGTYCIVDGLKAGTQYSCTVSSKDKVGNASSSSINATTVSIHKVTFYNGSTKYAEQNVVHGSKVKSLSSSPSKEYNTFKEWTIRGTGQTFNFNQAITSDLVLDATYRPNKIRVQYHVNVEEDKLKYINFNTGNSNKFSLDGQYLLNNGSRYVQVFNYNDILSLNNNNTLLNWNGNYINITRTFWSVVPGEEWFKTKNGPKKTYNGITFTTTESAISYNQDGTINAKDLCDAKNGDCVVTLYLNWKYKNLEPSHDEPLVSGGNLITHGCSGNPCCSGACNMVHDGGSSGAYYTTPGNGFYRQNGDGSWSDNLAIH